jgi:hypothetical protein
MRDTLLNVRRHMTFNELMILIAFTTPLFCSMRSGWEVDRGFGILIGSIIGLVLSVGSFWGIRVFFKWVGNHPKLSTPRPGVIWIGVSWFFFVALFVWILGFVFIGIWFTKFIIHDVAA